MNYILSYAFSDDLSQAVLRVPLQPLTADATPGIYNLFLRHADEEYKLVNTARPTMSNEELCSGPSLPRCYTTHNVAAYAGASNDFSHILFESNSQLTPEAPVTGIESLYESSEGGVKLVGILPDGVPAQGSTAGAGSRTVERADKRVDRAISEDGSHIVFQAEADGGEPDPAQIGLTEVYVRIDGEETIELSAPAPGATPAVTTPEPATFWSAAADGSKVFFTSSAELTTQSNTGSENNGSDLYEFDLESRTLRDLTIDTNPLDTTTGAMVQGVVGTSSDGAYVYFVANGQLLAGEGVDGEPNLYMTHNGGTPVFIATLSSSGECEFQSRSYADACDWTPSPYELEAYVTPDGQHMAFMSVMSLPSVNFPSGYDNVDVSTGEPDSEVYEYTAPTSEGGGDKGQLVCVSCDFTGAPPVGSALIGGITQAEGGHPPADNPISTPFHHVRAVSDDGQRVFYTAPLSKSQPQYKVYEYERSGTGNCAVSGGCQYMLSSSRDPESDQFLDASTSGDDVFVATAGQLSSADGDELGDVYDVRVDGGFIVPPGETVCENDCRLPSAAAAFSTLMGTSSGPSGNLIPPVKVSPGTGGSKHIARRCPKKRSLRHGKCLKTKTKIKTKKKKPARNAHAHGGGHS